MRSNTKYWQSTAAMIWIALGLAIVAIPKVYAQTSNPGVFAPDSVVFGRTYGDWSAAWWQYVLSIPAPNNPTNDTTGQFCDLKQSGPIWFLAGINSGQPVTRTCTLSAKKAIYLPIINVECSTVEATPFSCRDDATCRECAGEFADGVGVGALKATIDGVEVHALSGFRVQSPFFHFKVPDDNILGVPPGTGSSVSDGYWLMLKPLFVGSHVIHFEGAFVSGPGAGFSEDVMYNLTVTK